MDELRGFVMDEPKSVAKLASIKKSCFTIPLFRYFPISPLHRNFELRVRPGERFGLTASNYKSSSQCSSNLLLLLLTPSYNPLKSLAFTNP
jgi:hypothetical protein